MKSSEGHKSKSNIYGIFVIDKGWIEAVSGEKETLISPQRGKVARENGKIIWERKSDLWM